MHKNVKILMSAIHLLTVKFSNQIITLLAGFVVK